MNTSSEAYIAMGLLDVLAASPEMFRAKDFILSVGGLANVRIFTTNILRLIRPLPLESFSSVAYRVHSGSIVVFNEYLSPFFLGKIHSHSPVGHSTL